MRTPLPLLALLAACAAPDVTQDIAASRALLTAIQRDTGPALTRTASAEFRAAEDELIRQDEPVVELLQGCDPYATLPIGAIVQACRLASTLPAPSGVNARTTQDLLSVLDTYLEALTRLATATDVDAARKQASALVDAFGTPDPGRPEAFEALATEMRARRSLIVETTGFVLDQVRLAGLRRAIRRADPVIQAAIPDAAAYMASLDPALERADETRIRAIEAVETARIAGDHRAHRRAVDQLRTAQASFVAALERSPAARLRAFAHAHAQLERAAAHPGTLPRIVSLLEQLRALYDAAGE